MVDRATKTRQCWVELYKETKNAGFVCRRCGISRPTLRKWYRRYQEQGIDGLKEQSRKPHRSPNLKLTVDFEKLILQLRKDRKLGARRIQTELNRLHSRTLSLASIHKVLAKHKVKPLLRMRRKGDYSSYERPIPGDRVQLDTKKLEPGKYQYTAVDDCTRYRVLGIYDRRCGANTLLFLDKVIEEMPFPIQRIQTDRGREFFAVAVQKKLMQYGIKFRPIKPASPHLNGKVERSQKTDLQEFYSTVGLSDPDLEARLQEWQHYYNWHRPHGAHKGKTPTEKYFTVADKTPFWDEVAAGFDPSKERIQEANYWLDQQIRKVKRCL